MSLQAYRRGCVETENRYGLTPDQYHASVAKLWAALGITSVQSEDVFTLAAERIEKLTTALEDIAFSKTDSEAEGYQDVIGCVDIAQKVLDEEITED